MTSPKRRAFCAGINTLGSVVGVRYTRLRFDVLFEESFEMKHLFRPIACLLILTAACSSPAALARPKSQGGVSYGSGGNAAVPLPHNLTTDKDWLDDGAEYDMRPNAEDNDRYYLEAQSFRNNDPGRYSEMGSYLDSFPGNGW
jgi:hypothetical protein